MRGARVRVKISVLKWPLKISVIFTETETPPRQAIIFTEIFTEIFSTEKKSVPARARRARRRDRAYRRPGACAGGRRAGPTLSPGRRRAAAQLPPGGGNLQSNTQQCAQESVGLRLQQRPLAPARHPVQLKFSVKPLKFSLKISAENFS